MWLFLNVLQVGALENTRNQVLQGVIGVQKCFRSQQARRFFHDLKEGATTLQSCSACIPMPSKTHTHTHIFFCLESICYLFYNAVHIKFILWFFSIVSNLDMSREEFCFIHIRVSSELWSSLGLSHVSAVKCLKHLNWWLKLLIDFRWSTDPVGSLEGSLFIYLLLLSPKKCLIKLMQPLQLFVVKMQEGFILLE